MGLNAWRIEGTDKVEVNIICLKIDIQGNSEKLIMIYFGIEKASC